MQIYADSDYVIPANLVPDPRSGRGQVLIEELESRFLFNRELREPRENSIAGFGRVCIAHLPVIPANAGIQVSSATEGTETTEKPPSSNPQTPTMSFPRRRESRFLQPQRTPRTQRERLSQRETDNYLLSADTVPSKAEGSTPIYADLQPATSPTPAYREIAANGALVLITVASSLLDRQLAAQEKAFLREGGFTERLYRLRRKTRQNP